MCFLLLEKKCSNPMGSTLNAYCECVTLICVRQPYTIYYMRSTPITRTARQPQSAHTILNTTLMHHSGSRQGAREEKHQLMVSEHTCANVLFNSHQSCNANSSNACQTLSNRISNTTENTGGKTKANK